MALAACLIGYGEVGLWLKKEAEEPNAWVVWQGNPFLKWMEDYAGEDFQGAVSLGLGTHIIYFLPCLSVWRHSNATYLGKEMIEARAAADPPSPARYAEWLSVWERCVRLEEQFWDMAMNLS